MVPAAGGETTWVDLGRYTPTDMLVVSVGWTPGGDEVVFQVQNREQTWLDLNLAESATGEMAHLFRETTPAWVSVNGDPRWLEDGTFLWLSERSGWKHLYHYRADGDLIRQVTDGEWELRTLHGVDEDDGWVYFSGTRRSPIGGDVYRVRLDGGDLTRLSERPGTHAARFSPGSPGTSTRGATSRHPSRCACTPPTATRPGSSPRTASAPSTTTACRAPSSCR